MVYNCKLRILFQSINHKSSYRDGPVEDDTIPSSRDLIVIACVQITLAVATLLSAAICARIDCNT